MLYTFFMEQVWVKFERNAFSFQNRTICDLHVFTTSGNNLSLIRQALHRCSSIYFTSSLWNRAQFVALKESVKYIGILWNTYEIFSQIYFHFANGTLGWSYLQGCFSCKRETLGIGTISSVPWSMRFSPGCFFIFPYVFIGFHTIIWFKWQDFTNQIQVFSELYRFPRGRRCSSATWGHASALSSGM